MKNYAQLFRKSMILLAALFSAATVAAAPAYRNTIASYSDTWKIVLLLSNDSEIFDGMENILDVQRISWIPEMQSVITSAQKSNINIRRVRITEYIRQEINDEARKRFSDFNRAVERIMDKALSNHSDPFFSVAVLVRMQRFLRNNYSIIFTGRNGKNVRERAKNKLEESEEKVVRQFQDRFKDKELKTRAEKFMKLFPDAVLIVDQPQPERFSEVKFMFSESLRSAIALNKVSALAEFKEWGKHMLNCMLFDGSAELRKEFDHYMDSYENVFNTEE